MASAATMSWRDYRAGRDAVSPRGWTVTCRNSRIVVNRVNCYFYHLTGHDMAMPRGGRSLSNNMDSLALNLRVSGKKDCTGAQG